MTRQPKSIDGQILCLARMTGAPTTFVDQVRALFTSRGVSLDTDAAPFLAALEEAFRREENIRAGSTHARHELQKLRDNFRKVGEAYVDQLSQLRRLQSTLHPPARRSRKEPGRAAGTATRVTIAGSHRSLVTPTVREQYPMVPGPKDPQ